MFPLYDESLKRERKPLLVLALIIFNIFMFFITYFSSDFEQIIFDFGLIPEQISKGESFFTFLSSMFLHGDLIHLIGNMWFLWIFGDNLENNLGLLKFLGFYIIAGITASLVHILTIPIEQASWPIIGASGAISGVLGGYVTLFPNNKIRAVFAGYFRPYFLSIPAWFYAFVWFIYQLMYAGSVTSIAYMAHIGGFLTGIILTLPFRKKVRHPVSY